MQKNRSAEKSKDSIFLHIMQHVSEPARPPTNICQRGDLSVGGRANRESRDALWESGRDEAISMQEAVSTATNDDMS